MSKHKKEKPVTQQTSDDTGTPDGTSTTTTTVSAPAPAPIDYKMFDLIPNMSGNDSENVSQWFEVAEFIEQRALKANMDNRFKLYGLIGNEWD